MMGGFISEDPIGFAGGQNSFYAYVGGDPLDYTDSLGLWIPPAIPGYNGVMGAIDALSFGIGPLLRSEYGLTDGGLNPCSGQYLGGQLAAIIPGLFDGEGEAELLALNQSLAKEAQIAELAAGEGIPIAGAGTDTALRQAGRLAEDYGGEAEDWQKVASSSYTGADGTVMETHAYQNASTGWVVEPKTIFP
jgi:hypothetical protein